jgi:exodeoxyribonuclease VII large subunit
MEKDSQKIYQVSEFNQLVYNHLKRLGQITVEGEIYQMNVSTGKWLSITLKDDRSSVKILSAVYIVKNYAQLEEGMTVKVYGKPWFRRETGQFAIFADQILPSGIGALKIAFEKLKFKLEQEGLFDISRKRPLPLFPEKIGLITAKRSQAYADFIKVLKQRMGGLKIYFYPVRVQGRDSVSTILRAFKYFNCCRPRPDVLVLTRGGGSLEDLIAFNDEQAARAVFSSKIPVICGIGHENDFTLVDFVADQRASTPSNAAELLVRQRQEVLKDLDFKLAVMVKAVQDQIRQKNLTVSSAVNVLSSQVQMKIKSLKTLISQFNALFLTFKHNIAQKSQQAGDYITSLEKDVKRALETNQIRLAQLLRLLKSLDYKQILKRGYSITATARGKLVKELKDIKVKDQLTTLVFDGKIYSQVLAKEKKNGKT